MILEQAAEQSDYGMAVLELGREILVRQPRGYFAIVNGGTIMVEKATDRPSKFSTWRLLMHNEHINLRQAIKDACIRGN